MRTRYLILNVSKAKCAGGGVRKGRRGGDILEGNPGGGGSRRDGGGVKRSGRPGKVGEPVKGGRLEIGHIPFE